LLLSAVSLVAAAVVTDEAEQSGEQGDEQQDEHNDEHPEVFLPDCWTCVDVRQWTHIRW